jgi:hypothetical protein
MMWGNGDLRPRGGAFERQFEPTGIDRNDDVKGYLYRRNLEGRGVSVSPDEHRILVGTFAGYVLLRGFLAIVICVASAAAFFAVEPMIYMGDWSGISMCLGLIPAGIYCWWQRNRDWQRIDKKLAGRKKVGLDRSSEDAQLMRFALSGWTVIGYSAAVVAITVILVVQQGPVPQPRDWIWLAPLGAIVIGGLGRWSVLKARAIRICRERLLIP